MDKVIHFQMSLFGAFINIQPNQELTGKIVACLQDDDFIPSVAVVNTVDPIKKQVIREDRLQMESKDHTWHIIFFEERIDINYDYVMGGIVICNIWYNHSKDIGILPNLSYSISYSGGDVNIL